MRRELAPGFLIASPPLGDPNFDRTVVLLAVHGEGGALGFVVNRLAAMSLAELLQRAGYPQPGVAGSAPVYVGGPVQPSSGWILGIDLAVPPGESAIELGPRLRVTSSRAAFETLSRDRQSLAIGAADPQRRMVILGYSGWGPGQLEREIAAGFWLPVPLEHSVLFDVAVAERWERAYALLGLTPAGMISMRNVGEA